LPIPELNHLLEELFAKTWSHLHENTWSHLNNDYAKLPDRPGVYVLAYSDQELARRRVQEDEIYYVGVSHRGVLSRLKQFVKGLEDGGHHSGAKRFFRIKAGKMPYSQLINRETFFVASATVPCTYLKKDRTCLDLRKLGVVAALEWYVLAHIKEKTGREPELNKK